MLRLGLGQEDQAIKDGELFNKNYGSSKAAESAQIAFAIGAHYIEKEDWAEARKRLTSAHEPHRPQRRRSTSRSRPTRCSGTCSSSSTRASSAVSEYNKVRGAWKDPAAVVKKIQEGGDDRRLAKALTAVGEALFFFAEQQRKEVEKIRFPEYKGAGTREDVLKHVNTKVKDWVNKKRPAIEAAEKEYKKIVDLPAAAAAALGHRRRLPRRADVGQVRGRVPRRAHPQGVEGPRAGARRRRPHLRRAPRRVLLQARRGQRAAEADRQGRVQDVPRLLGQVPVLRRVLAQVRGVAVQELRRRVPPHRRVPRLAVARELGPQRGGAAGEPRRDGRTSRAVRCACRTRSRRPTPTRRRTSRAASRARQARPKRSRRSIARRGSEGASHEDGNDDHGGGPPRVGGRVRQWQRGWAEGQGGPPGRRGQRNGPAGLGGGGEQVQRRPRGAGPARQGGRLDGRDLRVHGAALPRRGEGAGRQDLQRGDLQRRARRTSAARRSKRRRRSSSRSSTTTPSSTAPRCSWRSTPSPTPARRTSTRRSPPSARRQSSTPSSRTSRRWSTSGCSYIKRNNKVEDQDGKTDLLRAKRFIQSAMALDDGYMPAFNQLAVLYLETAKQAAGRDTQAQGGERRVEGEEGRHPGARARGAGVLAGHPEEPQVRLHPQHRRHDPGRAGEPERRCLRVQHRADHRPLVLRGADELRGGEPAVPRLPAGGAGVPQGHRDPPERLRRAPRARARAARRRRTTRTSTRTSRRRATSSPRPSSSRPIARRPTTTRRSSPRSTRPSPARAATRELLNAKKLFGEFITKASGAGEFADAVKRSKERMAEIDQIIEFNKQSEKDRKASEADLKQKAAEAEAKGEEAARRARATRRKRRSRSDCERRASICRPPFLADAAGEGGLVCSRRFLGDGPREPWVFSAVGSCELKVLAAKQREFAPATIDAVDQSATQIVQSYCNSSEMFRGGWT